jgi:serine/threonine-protein kinase
MSRLAELLIEWEERLEAGESVTARDLCVNDPELLPALAERIERLQRFRAIDEPRDLPQMPASVGGYAVKQILGAGATGIVYMAKDRTLGRKVAIKVLSPKQTLMSGEDRRRLAERFKLEARVVAKLRHPAIVPIYEAELEHGEPYYVMEYLSGGSLQERLRAAPGQPAGTATEIALFMGQVAGAVEHAHASGVVHRDLKPGNILLDGAGQPKVTDFGLVKLIDETLCHDDSSALGPEHRMFVDEPNLTHLGRQPGTPAYMAPEQFDPTFALIGPPTDIWALGVVLYEMLTGHRPFAGEMRDELRQRVCRDPVVAPSAAGVQVHATLERLTLQCLDRDPFRRPTARALVDAFERYLNPGPVRRLANAALGLWNPVRGVLGRRHSAE